MGLRPRTPVTKSTRPVLAEMRADRRARREAKDAELDRQDREAAERLANLTPHRARGAEPVMAGPGDEMAAGAGGRDHLRASHADREQVIGTLQAAFVQGMLAKDEFDLRVGQTLTSRTYAELAARTADLPAGLAAAQPPQPARAGRAASSAARPGAHGGNRALRRHVSVDVPHARQQRGRSAGYLDRAGRDSHRRLLDGSCPDWIADGRDPEAEASRRAATAAAGTWRGRSGTPAPAISRPGQVASAGILKSFTWASF